MSRVRWAACALGLVAPLAQAGEWSLLSRNYLIDNDLRQPAARGHQREWAQGFIGSLSDEYERGPWRVGAELHGFLGLKLDGGRGHAGTGLLPEDSDGRAEDDYSSAGMAVHLGYGSTRLSYGEMRVATPVFATADKRLQPEYASGWLLQGQGPAALDFSAGRFTRFANQAGSSRHADFDGYGASTRHGGISLAGVRREIEDSPWGAALFVAQLDDTWNQGYLNLNGHGEAWSLDANLYRTRDAGSARAGAIDTLAYSLLGSLRRGSHRLSLGYQRIEGDTPFDFVGGDSIQLANSVKFADFNGPGERSWQLRYQWQAAALGLPGLSLSARYVRGSGIDGTHAPSDGAYVAQQGRGGRHWERDLEMSYRVQSGTAKGLRLSVAQVSHRANAAQAGPDLDRLYLLVEYPLSGRF